MNTLSHVQYTEEGLKYNDITATRKNVYCNETQKNHKNVIIKNYFYNMFGV